LLLPLVASELYPGQSSKCKKEQRAINPKLDKAELCFLCTALALNEIYIPTNFLVDIPVVSEICHGQSSKCKMEQRAFTPKLGKAVMVLMHCTSTY